MRIICTVSEFADMVRGCQEASQLGGCSKCGLYNICREYDGSIERFVSADDIVDNEGCRQCPG